MSRIVSDLRFCKFFLEFTMPDTGSSQLLSLTVPSVLDLRKGQIEAIFAASVSDPDGVRQVVVFYDSLLATEMGAYAFQIIHGYGSDWDDGNHSYTTEVLPHNVPGNVNITHVQIEDALGNKTTISAHELHELGVDTSIRVHSVDPDTTPPELTALDLPKVIDLSDGYVFADFSAKAIDENEIQQVAIFFDRDLSYSFGNQPSGFVSYSLIIVGGGNTDDWADGISVTRPFDFDTNTSGTVDIRQVWVSDVYGNRQIYTNDELRELGFDTSFEITGILPAMPATYVEMLPEVVTLREGETIGMALNFIEMQSHYVNYTYHVSTSGGTASAADIAALSGSGYLNVSSTHPQNYDRSFSITALRDGIQEDTETAYLVVELSGTMTFADGGRMQVVEIRIIDDNVTIGTARNDTLCGTNAAEDLIGGAGNDHYYVTSGDRVIEAPSEGNDTVYSPLSWTLEANVENLVITGSANLDGTGNGLANYITGNAGANVLLGAAGNDTIYGGGGDDSINGGIGADSLLGGAGNDTISGMDGFDVIHGGDGDDNLNGGAGNDTIYGDIGNDSINGGLGSDELYGGAGNDTIFGMNGHDVIHGGNGHDSLNGGAGNDTIYGDIGNDSINGGLGADELYGGADNDTIFGMDGFDLLIGGDGGDSLSGGNGNDILQGGAGNDALIGGLGSDSLEGGEGNDILNGLNGHDLLDGGAGDDRLYGGGGNDTLLGGVGNDTMRGGQGADVFVFNAGHDVITDYSLIADRLVIDASLMDEAAPVGNDLRNYASVVNDNLVFDFGDDHTLTLNGVTNINPLLDDVTYF